MHNKQLTDLNLNQTGEEVGAGGSREQIKPREQRVQETQGLRVQKEEVRGGGGEGIGSRQRAGSESRVPGQRRLSGRDAKSSVQEKLPIEAEHRATHRGGPNVTNIQANHS